MNFFNQFHTQLESRDLNQVLQGGLEHIWLLDFELKSLRKEVNYGNVLLVDFTHFPVNLQLLKIIKVFLIPFISGKI